MREIHKMVKVKQSSIHGKPKAQMKAGAYAGAA